MLTRILTALVAIPIVLGLVLWPGGATPFPGWPFALLVLAMVVIALREFYDGCRTAGHYPLDGFGYASGLLFLFLATPFAAGGRVLLPLGLTVLVMASLVAEAFRPQRAPLKNLAVTWLGAMYVGWLFPFALRLRLELDWFPMRLGWYPTGGWMQAAGAGGLLVAFTLIVTGTVDSGAYFVGKSIGRHKLAPLLSPGKTWEGAIGGFGAGMLMAWALGAWFGLPLPFALAAGALIGVLSQLGDLSKSAIKREIGIKDFGMLFPGHGGMLDRFDSLLFTAPAIFWLAVFRS